MSTYHYREWRIRSDMVEALKSYVDHGIPPGDFLHAVLCHDGYQACASADNDNLRNLPAFFCWLNNEAPSPCHGSEKKVREWIERKAKIRAEQSA